LTRFSTRQTVKKALERRFQSGKRRKKAFAGVLDRANGEKRISTPFSTSRGPKKDFRRRFREVIDEAYR
jgi:hypothetical protein